MDLVAKMLLKYRRVSRLLKALLQEQGPEFDAAFGLLGFWLVLLGVWLVSSVISCIAIVDKLELRSL